MEPKKISFEDFMDEITGLNCRLLYSDDYNDDCQLAALSLCVDFDYIRFAFGPSFNITIAGNSDVTLRNIQKIKRSINEEMDDLIEYEITCYDKTRKRTRKEVYHMSGFKPSPDDVPDFDELTDWA